MPKYTEKDIENAISDVLDGSAVNRAARIHGIPTQTLRDRICSARPRRLAHENQQRFSSIQEKELVSWVLRQEALGYSPTHAQLRGIATAVLKKQGDLQPLGKRWTTHFIKRHDCIKTKLGRRTDWQRINAACPANINRLFDLYETVNWIAACNTYNGDEGGIMAGMGINGLVIGSSMVNEKQAPVKTDHQRSWTSFIECISATGKVLDPLVIFKAQTIQDQWFHDEILKRPPFLGNDEL